MKIFIIGMWHLGCVTAAGMKQLGHEVICFDFDPTVINKLSNKILPIYEKGLYEILFGGSIKFTNNIKQAETADFIFITYDISANGVFIDIIDKIIEILKGHIKKQLIVIGSQVPVGTCEKIQEELKCEVCYMPENLCLGTALHNFFNPDSLVFGTSSKNIIHRISQLFETIKTQKVFIDLREAEMVKLAMNSYLATVISFSGEISNICELLNINAKQVFSTIKLDKRVSKTAPIMPGLGIGGGSLMRDVKSLRKLGHETLILDAIYNFNEYRKSYVEDKLKSILGDLKGKTITFFGLSYKPGTDTLRESTTLKIIRELLKTEDIKIKVYDPLIKSGINEVEFIDIQGAKNSDALVIMHDSEEFRKINYKKLKCKVILDTKGIVSSIIPHYEIGIKGII